MLHVDDHWQQLSEMLEFSEMMLETWLQLALQEYLIYYYYYDVRLESPSQNLSLMKSLIILVPLTMKAIMPEDTFTKLPQETWIIAIKRMVWVTFLYIAMTFTFLLTMLSCIASLEQPIKLWILSSSVMISGFFIIMSFRKSGYGRLKCYTLCFLFFQFGILWILSIIGKNLQELSFKGFIIYYLDDSSYVMLSAVIVVVFAKAAKIIKNLHGNMRFIKENPDYMLLDDFEIVARVVTSIGLKSKSKLPNIYFCTLIMMELLLVCGLTIQYL